ncbi:hypothetical protein Leryth_010119 [Lithospermum erythrorhizon]|nr:hypothetical protein Leryth_010119 [Lithospermum erythrorhizon]
MAIQTLLISDHLFRSADTVTRQRYAKLVSSVKQSDATAFIFSPTQLAHITGIAAILWFPLPDLNHIEIYDPEMDGRILLPKIDCTEEVDLCRWYPLLNDTTYIASETYVNCSILKYLGSIQLSCWIVRNHIQGYPSIRIFRRGSDVKLSLIPFRKDENQKSFSHFITNVCAIIGGVFTVAGILDSIYNEANEKI